MALVLRALGKRAAVFNTDRIPPNFAFLPGASEILFQGPLPFRPQVALFLDTPSPPRLGRALDLIGPGTVRAAIDHHVSNPGYTGLDWIDPSAPCTAEMVLRLGRRLGVPLGRDLALCVYVALLTDMGKFQFMVTPGQGKKIFELAGRLTAKGLVPYEIYKKVYNVYDPSSLKLLAAALSNLHVTRDGLIGYVCLDRETTARFHFFDDTNDALIAQPRDLASTRVALLFAEHRGGVKVSFRSKEPDVIDVNRIAAHFGGGGHAAAAGAEVPGDLGSVVPAVLRRVRAAVAAAGPRGGKRSG